MSKPRKEGSGEDQFFQSEHLSWAIQEIAYEPPPILAQFGVIFLFSFFVASLIYISVVKVPATVDGIGRIATAVAPVPIRATASFTVDQILVKDNQLVKAGEKLVTSVENLSEEDRIRLERFIKEIKKITGRSSQDLCRDCIGNLNAIAKLYLTIHAEGGFLGLISPINDLVRQLRSEIVAHSQIKGSMAGVELQVKNAKRKLQTIEARGASQVLAKEVEDLKSVIVNGNAQISQRYRDAGRQIFETRSTLNARTKELEDRLREMGRAFTVYAPASGRISDIKLKGSGELISSGQVMMELIPEGSQLVAAIDILNRDISKVKTGDKVIVSIDSLPEVDYGSLQGTLIEVRRVESAEGRPGEPVSAQGDRAYRGTVQLSAQSLGSGGDVKPLLLGMSLKGRIVTGSETLLHRLFVALFNVKERIKAHG